MSPAGPRRRLKRSHVDAEVSGQSSQWEEFALRRTHGEGLPDATEEMCRCWSQSAVPHAVGVDGGVEQCGNIALRCVRLPSQST